MRACKRCGNPVWQPGEDGRGSGNRRLCRLCWSHLLREAQQQKMVHVSERKTLAMLAQEYGVSLSAVTQKIAYLIEQGVR